MFFIKLTFWLGVIVLLLPTDQEQQARLYTTAVHTIERATTFCDRNARTCEVAGQAWATFLKKARGRLVARCSTAIPDWRIPCEHVVEASINDAGGDVVAQVRVRWKIGPKA